MSLLPLQHRVAASAQTTCSSCLLRSLDFQKQLRPGSQRAYSRAVAVAAAAPVSVDQIPRQPGVSDGAWDAADAAAVRKALRDGQQAASTSGRTGEAPCSAPLLLYFCSGKHPGRHACS